MMPVFAPRSARPELPRDWIPVQRFEFRIDRAVAAFRAHPVRPSPFPVGPFGSVSFRRRSRFLTPEAFLSAGCPSPRSSHLPDCIRIRMRMHLSWGSVPLQRSTTGGARIPRWRCKATGTVRPQGFPPSRRLSSPSILPGTRDTLSDIVSPGCAPGVPPTPPARTGSFRIRTGPVETGCPLQGSPRPRDERVFARYPLLRFVLSTPRPFHRPRCFRNGRFRVSIAGPSALPAVANCSCRPS